MNGVGGIAGRNGNNNVATETGKIWNCYNNASIICTSGKWVGGICGFENSLSECYNCYNSGTFNMTSGSVTGGINYSVYLNNDAFNVTPNALGSFNIAKTVYLKSGKYIGVGAKLKSNISLEMENSNVGQIVAIGNTYYLTDADAGKFTYSGHTFGVDIWSNAIKVAS